MEGKKDKEYVVWLEERGKKVPLKKSCTEREGEKKDLLVREGETLIGSGAI